jgi:cytochrome d ubiquinol oxidase subunit II
MQYVGGFINLLNPYALLGGLAAVFAFALQGAIFLSLKTMGAMQDKSQKTARKLWLPEVIILLLFLVGTYLATDIQDHLGINPGIIPLQVLCPHCWLGILFESSDLGGHLS